MLDEQAFQRAADNALESLRKALLPASEEHEFEVDFNAGTLTIEFEEPSPAKFVISPNTPVRQIWVSALARSFKLHWDPARQTFALPASGETLTQLVTRVTGQHLGAELRTQ